MRDLEGTMMCLGLLTGFNSRGIDEHLGCQACVDLNEP
jgi:hypothetical protein